MTNLQKLESAIRTALPELMELSEGCVVMAEGQKYTIGWAAKVIWPNKKEIEIGGHKVGCFTTIGHPVSLLHLLRWLDTIKIKSNIIYACIYFDGELQITFCDLTTNSASNKLGNLDLTKPLLSQQSKEVIDELCKLLN